MQFYKLSDIPHKSVILYVTYNRHFTSCKIFFIIALFLKNFIINKIIKIGGWIELTTIAGTANII